MSLDVGDALRDGASRTTEPNGLLLMVGFAAVALASLVARHSYISWAIEQGDVPAELLDVAGPNPDPLAVGMPVLAAIGLWFGTVFVAEGLRIVAIRTFVSDHTDRIPVALATRRIGWAVLNGFVGTFLVTVLIVLGGLLFILPGVFLAVSFFFVRQEIAVEDVNFVDAMRDSWERTGGNRVELAVLGMVWIALWLLVLVVTGAAGAALASAPSVAAVVSVILGAPLSVFGVAVGARAYVQLGTGDEERAADVDGRGDDGLGGDRDDVADEDRGDSLDEDSDDDEEWPDPPGLDIRSRAP